MGFVVWPRNFHLHYVVRVHLCKDRNQNSEISILKDLKALNLGSYQIWILRLWFLPWSSIQTVIKMRREKLRTVLKLSLKKKGELLWQIGILLGNLLLWPLLSSAMCTYWIESGWIRAMTKYILLFSQNIAGKYEQIPMKNAVVMRDLGL